MNFGQLYTAVQQRVGSDTADGVLTKVVIQDFVREAVNAIEVEKDWDWLDITIQFPTVIGVDAYSPPADLSRTRHLRLTTIPDHLAYLGIEAADEYLGVTPTASWGLPVAWAWDSNKIILRPVPNAVYTVEHRYLRTEPALALDTDTPLLPARFHWALVDYACSRCWTLVGMDDRATLWMNAYERWLGRMNDDRRRVSRPGVIRVREPIPW